MLCWCVFDDVAARVEFQPKRSSCGRRYTNLAFFVRRDCVEIQNLQVSRRHQLRCVKSGRYQLQGKSQLLLQHPTETLPDSSFLDFGGGNGNPSLMSEEIDKHVLRRFEICQKLGKGVSSAIFYKRYAYNA